MPVALFVSIDRLRSLTSTGLDKEFTYCTPQYVFSTNEHLVRLGNYWDLKNFKSFWISRLFGYIPGTGTENIGAPWNRTEAEVGTWLSASPVRERALDCIRDVTETYVYCWRSESWKLPVEISTSFMKLQHFAFQVMMYMWIVEHVGFDVTGTKIYKQLCLQSIHRCSQQR